MSKCGFRGKPIMIPGSSRSPLRSDSDHDSGEAGLYVREELRASRSPCREAVRDELALIATIKGIHYEQADIWDVVERVRAEDVSFFASVPHYARGYEKMFAAPSLKWNEPAIPQFEPKRFPELLQRLGEAKCAALLWPA